MVPKQCPLLRSTFWYLFCYATCFVREIIPNTIHTDLTSHPQTYMTEIGFSSIVRLRLRAFGAQHPSELVMACLA